MSRITKVSDLQGRKFKFNENLTFNSNYYFTLHGGTSSSPAATYYNGVQATELYSSVQFMQIAQSKITLWQERDLAATVYANNTWQSEAGTINFNSETITLTVMNTDGSYNYSSDGIAAFIAWWNSNTAEVYDTLEERYAGLFRDIAYEIRKKDGTTFKIEAMNYPARIRALSANGITPAGTITLRSNGEHDVTNYAIAKINVPTSGTTPSGTITITSNGTHDVTDYAYAEVEIESGGITPSGTLDITSNGDHDVTNYATASVNVPVPDGYIIPTGQLSITSNGTHNAAQYETVNVNVPNVIPDGYIIPEGTLSITANGDYDATQYASVSVNVASSGGGGDTSIEDGLIQGTLTSYTNDRIAKIRDYGFAYCSSLTSLSVPNATKAGSYAFYNCSALTSLNIPNITSIEYASCRNIGVTEINWPQITYLGSYAIAYCNNLTKVNLPSVANVSSSNALAYNPKLEIVDLASATGIASQTFYNNYILKAVILRSSKMATLANKSAFTGCYHILGTTNSTYNPNGDKDGYIYVPRDLVASYQAATNWSTYSTQFRALEDYTVDGTTTGALDETKI